MILVIGSLVCNIKYLLKMYVFFLELKMGILFFIMGGIDEEFFWLYILLMIDYYFL